MLYHVITLSILIAVILLVRGMFRRSVPQRLIYALWLAVVVRLCLPFSLFEVTFPVIEKTAETAAEEQESADAAVLSNTVVSADTIVSAPVILPQDLAPAVIPQTETVKRSEPVSEPSETEPLSPEPEEPVPWSRIVRAVWITGSGLMGIWFFFTGLAFRNKLHRDRRQVGIIEKTKIYVSDNAVTPCLAGLIPAVYLTPAAAESKARTLVILHEYTHLRHGDHLWNLVRTAALIVYWWNPLVWAAVILSRQDAELACDEAVAAKLNDTQRSAYAHIIIDTIPEKRGYAVGLGSAPIKERLLMLTGKRKIRWIAVVLAVVLAFAAAGCSFMNRHPLTRDNIMEQNGFTILSQETETITLTLPMGELPLYAQLAARERKDVTWETEGIAVYDDGVTRIDLKSIGISGSGGDRDYPAEENTLFFKFDITHTLPEEGSIFTVNRVMNTGDDRTYSSRFFVPDRSVTDDAAIYEDAVREMGNGPGDLFYMYMDAAVYEKLTGTASFDITLNKISYERGSEVREYGDDIQPLDDSAESRYAAAEAQIDLISETYRTLTNAYSRLLNAIEEYENFRQSVERGDTAAYEGYHLTYEEAGDAIAEEEAELEEIKASLNALISEYKARRDTRYSLEGDLFPETDNSKSSLELYREYLNGEQTMHTLMQHEAVQSEAAAKINMILTALHQGTTPVDLFDPAMVSGLSLPEGAVFQKTVTPEEAVKFFDEFEPDSDMPYRFVIPLWDTERLIIGFTVAEYKNETGIFPLKIWNETIETGDGQGGTSVSEYIFADDGTSDGYWMPAASYGNIHDSFVYTYFDQESMHYVTVIGAGNAGEWYQVFGLQSDRRRIGDFTEYRTYHITAENGSVTSCEEVPTITKEMILEEGKPYSGLFEGEYSCRNSNSNGDLIRRSIEIQADGTMTVSAGKDGTDAGGVYNGTFKYVTDTGELAAKLVLTTYSNGEVTVSDPMEIRGKLYEYGGFVHFLCEASEMYDISPDDPLPLTFVPDDKADILGDEFAGGWYHCFRDDNGSQFYYLEFDSALPQMHWDYGYYESEYVNRYTGVYSIDENGVISASLHDSSILHSDPDITLTFTVNMTENGLAVTFLSCDVEKYAHLVDRTVVYDSRELVPLMALEKAGS